MIPISIADTIDLLALCLARRAEYPVEHPEYIKISGQIVRLQSSIEDMEARASAKKNHR